MDYDTENLKANIAIHHKFKDNSQFIMSSSFGTGTTVYQGDNRYSLKNYIIFSKQIEYKVKKDLLELMLRMKMQEILTMLYLQRLLMQNCRKK